MDPSGCSISVSFSPTEVDHFQRVLECDAPNLAPGTPLPRIAISGRSLRPYCHMEMQEADYVRAGRRSPDMPGPDGSLGPLDPATKVLEFESLGTKVRNTRRFYVVNPTNRTYDFLWEAQADPAAEVLAALPFRCQTRKGTVLAG